MTQKPSLMGGRAVRVLKNTGDGKNTVLKTGGRAIGAQNLKPSNYQRRLAARMPIGSRGAIWAGSTTVVKKYVF